MRVLLVEDDVRMAAAIRRGLRTEGMVADATANGRDAPGLVVATDYDAIVLDVLLSDLDGFETCRRLRANGVWLPIIMLTARDAVEDRVRGLDAGADDYLTKPFSFCELLARLRALARRAPVERPAVLEAGDLRQDPATRQVWRGEAPTSAAGSSTSRAASPASSASTASGDLGHALTGPAEASDPTLTFGSEASLRTIAHLDCDAFYATVELNRRPDLRGLPVVVAGSGPRAVVTTASYEARRFGIGSAMPAARARRLCPDAVFIPPDFHAYREVSGAVMARVAAAAEAVEQAGLDEAYLDLTGHVAPRAAMRRLVAGIRAATGIGCSVGIGPSKLVAKLASDAEKPDGFVALSRQQAFARFADRPAAIVPGIGPKTAERLERLGLPTVRALARASPEQLSERFGPRLGPWLRRRARLEDEGAVSGERVAVSESRERTFPFDVADRAEQERIIEQLATELCGALRAHERRGRTIAIKVRLDDFTTITRARTAEDATDDSGRVARVAVELLRAYAPPRPVRLLGVRVAGFEAAPGQGDPGQLALPL